MEAKTDTSTKTNGKMTRVQKVIVILTAVVLAIFLIVFAATRYMESPATYPIDTETSTSETNSAADSEKEEENSDETETGGSHSDVSGNESDEQHGGDKGDKPLDTPEKNQDDDDGEEDDDKNPGDEKPDSDNDDTSDTSSDPKPDGGNNPDTDEKPDNPGESSGGIHEGDSVTITSIGDSTITVSVGNETIVIPVQTTLFNGRVTKSGVISDSLCGYSIGASVMLYYPDGGSLDGVMLSGAYVKVDSTRLTVSGDYNGDGSKIVFRINGVRLSQGEEVCEMNNTYILNRETGKIELHFDKSQYDALPEEKKRLLKSNYLFSGRLKAWVSRAKFPNLYCAKNAARELGFTEEEKVGERLSYAEQVEQQTERAEARADRYLGYAENAERRGADLQRELNDRHGDIAFFTQPIIPGHAGSESFAKRRQRIYDRYDRGMEEYRKSEYFRDRAASAMVTAENAKVKDPAYLNNRIKECQSSIKKIRENIAYYEKILADLKDPDSAVSKSGRYTAEKVNGWLEDALETLEMQVDKLGYFQNCVEALGGFQFSRENIKVGYVVEIRHNSRFKILKTNPKTVLARCLSTGMILTYDYAEIKKVVSAVEEKMKQDSEPHPYQKDDILVWNPHGGNRPIYAYQVLSVTEKSVQIRRLKQAEDGKPLKGEFAENSKPLRRTPRVRFYSGQWFVTGERDCVLEKYVEDKR